MPDLKENLIYDLDYYFENGDIRENLINWYDFKPGSNILFIGNDVYKSLLKSNNVTIIEEKRELYEKIKIKNSKEILNMTLLELLESNSYKNKKFDYIVVSSAMKRIGDFVGKNKRDDAFKEFLTISSKILSEKGVILFPVENKFAIKNFSGATYEGGAAYDVILGKKKNGAIYTKKEITRLIENSNYKYFRLYYPFPDYKLPSIVYSDEYLPNGNNSKLSYLIYFNPDDTIIFNEMSAIREIVKDGMLDYFANSYLIEISNSKENLSKVKFASFNNFRRPENKLITKMYDGYVEKTPIFDVGKKHIESVKENINILKKCNIDIIDKVENGKIISKYQTLPTLNETLGQLVSEEEFEIVKKIIKKWYELLYNSFMCMFCEITEKSPTIFEKYDIIVDNKIKKKMHFLEKGLFDFIFENLFVEFDKEYNFKRIIAYDQEWKEDMVPIEFILYRALFNLYSHNSKISNYIPINEFFVEYGIEEYVYIFENLENKIQDSLIDHKVADAYAKSYAALTNLEGLNSIIEAEKEKYNRLLEATEKTNANWQIELERLQDELKGYRNKDIVYKLKNKLNRNK